MPAPTEMDEIKREVAAMSTDELVAAIMASAGSRPDIEDLTGEGWGFYDWPEDPDDQDIPV